MEEPRITITLNLGDPAGMRGLANLLAALGQGEPRHEAGGMRHDGNGSGSHPPVHHHIRTSRIKPMASWAEFEATLTNKTRQFIARLRQDGQLTMPQVLMMFEMPDTTEGRKAIGGMVGAMSRKAGNREIALPFRTSENKLGDRMWCWTGEGAGVAATSGANGSAMH